MAISSVTTNVLDVGQGQCTFVVVRDDKNDIAHTLLFDCGTDKKSDKTDTNIQWIADTLKLMDTPTIDLLVFSHSDNDHISLMYDLLEAYGSKKKLKILSVWYAGDADFYTKDGFNILDYLGKYCKSFTTPDHNESQYDSGKHRFDDPPMWESADKNVQVSMLMGNVIDNEPGIFKQTGFGTTAEKKNRVSIVCALMHDDRSQIICGDATSRTMAWINYYFGKDVFTKTLMLTLPHHGSRATGLNVSSGGDANQKAIEIVKTFATLAAAKTLTISAYAKHDHPSVELINYFVPGTVTTAVLKDTRLSDDSHFAVCNVDVTLLLPTLTKVTADYHTLTSQANVFATYYWGSKAGFSYQFKPNTVADPPKFVAKTAPAVNAHACWVYTTTAGKGNTVAGYKFMPAVASWKFTNDGKVTEAVAETVTTGAFFTDEGRPQPPHPSQFFPDEPPPLPPVWVPRAPASGRSLAASSLARLRSFR